MSIPEFRAWQIKQRRLSTSGCRRCRRRVEPLALGPISTGMALGIAIGTALGAAVGPLIFEDTAIGIAVGIALGAAAGGFARKHK